MPASIRVIKIVKDFRGGEAYTVEFECEAENAKDLIKELTASPYGERLITLLNESKFLPEISPKTIEELKKEAKAEEKEREEHEEKVKDKGRKEGIIKMFAFLRKQFGDDFVKEVENEMAKTDKEEETVETALTDNDREQNNEE